MTKTTNKNVEIKEFDPVIFPFRLWTGYDADRDTVVNKFYAYNHGTILPLRLSDVAFDGITVATTMIVQDKITGWSGCFVDVHRRRAIDASAMAHEADHVATYVCEKFGVKFDNFDNSETHAYIVQWAVKCLMKK